MREENKSVTDSLTGTLSDPKLDESEYKKHLEEKHLKSEKELIELLEEKLQAGINSGISKRSMDEIFEAAMARAERGKGESERGLELLAKALNTHKAKL